MMYLLSLLTSLCGLAAVGVFLDHYLWELDTTRIFISSTQLEEEDALTIGDFSFTSFQYLITTEGYHFLPNLQYSFYLEVAGACLPLLVTLLSWRLAMLIPSQKPSREGRKVKKAEKNFHLKESNSLQYFSPVKSPVFQLGDLSSPYSASGPAMTSSTNTTPSMSTEQLPVPLQGEVLY